MSPKASTPPVYWNQYVREYQHTSSWSRYSPCSSLVNSNVKYSFSTLPIYSRPGLNSLLCPWMVLPSSQLGVVQFPPETLPVSSTKMVDFTFLHILFQLSHHCPFSYQIAYPWSFSTSSLQPTLPPRVGLHGAITKLCLIHVSDKLKKKKKECAKHM